MKKLIILAMCSALAFCSCGQKQTEVEEKVYTEDELGVEIDWNSSGWSEVKNDTDGTVTLITFYSLDPGTEVTTVIKKGEFAKLTAGAYVPGVSIDECIKATIILDDNTTFSCERDSEDAWASRFFENFEQRKEYEYVDIDGKTVSHELIVRTYHIDDELVKLWRDSLPAPGDWPPIKLDRKEYLFNCYSGEVTITALNYESWWINYGYEDARNVNGKIEYDNFVSATYASNGAAVRNYLDGGWYQALVPNNGQSNQLIITVGPNDTGQQRHATLTLQCCNAFTHLRIYQDF